ncbi:MAG: ScnB-like protein [Pseudomonadota bacterium]
MSEDQRDIGRRWHDMGGKDAGDIDRDEHDHAIWEKRVDALRQVASDAGYFTVDGLRRALEDMGEEAFETMTYYERWMLATCQNLMAGGAFTTEELNAKMEEVKARGATYGDAQG